MSFHFLRPEWLLALIPTGWILWKLWRSQTNSSSWQSIIDPAFQSVLLGETVQKTQFPWMITGLTFIWFTIIFALSGPTWKSVEQPAEKSGQGTAILLDMSLSMLSDDLKPNRISRAKYKLTDLLKSHPEMASGLVVYAGSAHSLTPISEDNQTLLSLIKTLSPMMMPALGSNAKQGVEKALSLIAGAQVKHGHLIWILDDIEPEEISTVVDKIKEANVSVSILAVGTQTGGPIAVPNYGLVKDNDDNIVLAKLPFTRLQNLADQLGAPFTLIQNDDSDLDKLLPPSHFETQKTEKPDPKKLSHWLDNGIYLLIGLLPLIALAFRRGWLLTISFMVLCLPGLFIYPSTSYAENTEDNSSENIHLLDVLKSPDQQGFEKWQQQKYDAALDRFESPTWKAATFYRLGKYNEAIKLFEQTKTPEARFNQGNALAQLGQFEQAKNQYQEALKTKPDWKEAQENLKLIEKLLEQQRQKKQQQEQSQKKQNAKNDHSTHKKPKPQQSEQKDQSGQADHQQNDLDNAPESEDKKTQNQQDQQTPGQQKNAENSQQDQPGMAENANKDKDDTQAPSDGKGEEKEQAKQQLTGKGEMSESNQKYTSQEKLTEKEQAQRAWLNQIPDDPGLFLKRKFEYQYQQQSQQNEPETKKIW